ncbi:aldo/keto reductase [Paludibaculum fermentans]|uniref:Aldo/keto reductase n=1 Tax=Paludibaculum fermentans TaxID=1473598 RepID=A0A7S7NT83_PALFE|nr:aldo/keto reductase [Paludibaculum fermentans]QOY89401.1 aldo/keto reductase [Paludibaculum fermentans]
MRYRLLGNSGLRVSEAALGTMTFGDDWGWGSGKQEARTIYDAFREAGGNFIDTANIYTNGTSESLLGEFMEGHRESVVLATKYSNAFPGTDPNAAGNQRKNMMQAVDASLKRLKTDYIDLYWVHIWDGLTPVEEVMRGLDDLVRSGKVLYTGISDAPAWWIAQANTLAQLRGWTAFAGLQIEYSLIERTVERELIPMAQALNIGVTAWSPLGGGVLTGKYHGGGALDGRMNHEMMKDFQPAGVDTDGVVAAVKSVAEEVGQSMAQVALAWLQSRPVPVIPILGARKLSQFQDNLASLELKLTAEQVKTLDDASKILPGFPEKMFRMPIVQAIRHGGLRDRILA